MISVDFASKYEIAYQNYLEDRRQKNIQVKVANSDANREGFVRERVAEMREEQDANSKMLTGAQQTQRNKREESYRQAAEEVQKLNLKNHRKWIK